ncbi:NifB/NifX family molybdenum-iron cluster-binding protein [Pelotalea chapellei]|uniref:Dinitrogenase iron-molybdenum cofactor biosynthesis protein n=1 Tax=Pelotalea chapellei TaxID=44671 RepID=A0ABS5U893_9BACT|nr:NifB/NifX family molybdenum-iron cluster-binding protein [Pelotalea chapellei]MBT1071889.1 dinitrogenase iron-molybdenum cofactor biosynthesis protein [Pelotalea chapellei]
MLIAVASKDGKEINQHFGHAERFLIYEVENGEVRLVDEKKVDRYCSYDPEHPLRGHLLRDIGTALAGCRAVVTAQMGEHPRSELEQLGIEPFTLCGPIHFTLVEVAKIL